AANGANADITSLASTTSVTSSSALTLNTTATGAADDVVIKTTGAERVRVLESNGNVGIGTSLPSNALSVVGNADVSSAVFSPQFGALPGAGNGVSLTGSTGGNTGLGGSVSIAPGNAGTYRHC